MLRMENQNDTANVHPKSLTHLQGQFTFHSASSNTSFPYFCDTFFFLHVYYSNYYCLTFMNYFTGFPILLLILWFLWGHMLCYSFFLKSSKAFIKFNWILQETVKYPSRNGKHRYILFHSIYIIIPF